MPDHVLLSLFALFVFGVALWAASWLVRAPAGPISSLNLLMRVAAWSLIASAVVCVCLLAMMLVGGIIVWFATFAVMTMLFNRARLTRQDELLAVMATCTERSLPLEPVLSGLSQEFHGLSRWRLQRLVRMLRDGIWLPDALERAGNVVPRRAIVATRVGVATGRLPEALRDTARTRGLYAAQWNAVAGRVALIAWTLLAALLIVNLSVFVLYPRLDGILQEFDLTPFAYTIDWSGSWPLLLALAVTQFIGFMILCMVLYLLGVYLGWLPAVHTWVGFPRAFETAPLLRNLALVAESNQPAGRGLMLMSTAYPQWLLRRRLRRAANLVEGGAPLGDALHQAKLVSGANAGLVRAAQRVGNLPWSLRMIADSAERRLLYRVQAVAQTVLPVVLVALGLVVGLVALSVFVPLIQLTFSLVQ